MKRKSIKTISNDRKGGSSRSPSNRNPSNASRKRYQNLKQTTTTKQVDGEDDQNAIITSFNQAKEGGQDTAEGLSRNNRAVIKGVTEQKKIDSPRKSLSGRGTP